MKAHEMTVKVDCGDAIEQMQQIADRIEKAKDEIQTGCMLRLADAIEKVYRSDLPSRKPYLEAIIEELRK